MGDEPKHEQPTPRGSTGDPGAGQATHLTYVDGRATALSVRRFALEVVSGPDAGRRAVATDGVLRLGTRAVGGLALTDKKVSRLHAEITLDESDFRLRDLGSTNGTYVGGRRVRDIALYNGDILELGQTKLRFTVLAETTEVTLADEERFGDLVGGSVVMRALFARLARFSATDSTVLIGGPTGSGKEVAAEAIHLASSRAGRPFVVLDCSAVTASLIESEIFGHERGAFTGAHATHLGAFERAHTGTLFIDELGELPLGLQPKLLRVLEQRTVQRVGGTKPIPVDVRVIAATHRDLPMEVNQGRFRADLYYRLAVAEVRMPALDERREDIPRIAHALRGRFGEKTPEIPPEVLRTWMNRSWPGNVRELRNTVERYVRFGEFEAPGGELRPTAEPSDPTDTAHAQPSPSEALRPFREAKAELVEAFEREYLEALLIAHDGNLSAAARAAHLDRMSIHKMIQRLGMHDWRSRLDLRG